MSVCTSFLFTGRYDAKPERAIQIESNQIKFYSWDKNTNTNKRSKSRKWCANRTQRQQRTALTGALNRNNGNKYKNNVYSLKWNVVSLRLKQATEGDATKWSRNEFQILMTRLAKKTTSLSSFCRQLIKCSFSPVFSGYYIATVHSWQMCEPCMFLTRSSANAKRTSRPLQKYMGGTPNIWELP